MKLFLIICYFLISGTIIFLLLNPIEPKSDCDYTIPSYEGETQLDSSNYTFGLNQPFNGTRDYFINP